MTDFTLVPQKGALPLTFEMTPTEVQSAVGPPESSEVNDSGELEERRAHLIVRYSSLDSLVVEIAFLPAAKVWYKGHDLFRERSSLQFLSREDPPYEFVGFLIFLGLGITLTGFHDNDESQKAITVFRAGRWDEFKSEMTLFAP
jgi:hypothetical protein